MHFYLNKYETKEYESKKVWTLVNENLLCEVRRASFKMLTFTKCNDFINEANEGKNWFFPYTSQIKIQWIKMWNENKLMQDSK